MAGRYVTKGKSFTSKRSPPIFPAKSPFSSNSSNSMSRKALRRPATSWNPAGRRPAVKWARQLHQEKPADEDGPRPRGVNHGGQVPTQRFATGRPESGRGAWGEPRTGIPSSFRKRTCAITSRGPQGPSGDKNKDIQYNGLFGKGSSPQGQPACCWAVSPHGAEPFRRRVRIENERHN